MTIEQKAKAYDDALERAKNVLETDLHESGVWAIKKIFPELQESDDERIRKFLIELLSNGTWRKEYPFSPVDCVAWLEKQKEQKPVEWSEDDEHRCGDAIYFLETAKKHYADTSELDATIFWLKSIQNRGNSPKIPSNSPKQTLEQVTDKMESKHTEVWVEGRTIFEQDAKKPEVDLEKEIREWYGLPDYIDIRTLFDTAKHFYELGLKARKEE